MPPGRPLLLPRRARRDATAPSDGEAALEIRLCGAEDPLCRLRNRGPICVLSVLLPGLCVIDLLSSPLPYELYINRNRLAPLCRLQHTRLDPPRPSPPCSLQRAPQRSCFKDCPTPLFLSCRMFHHLLQALKPLQRSSFLRLQTRETGGGRVRGRDGRL